ncbi:glutamate receptor 3-like [Uloborus diversus]|uniref:glutamate receptor 3-like n=1 Tax=Uloborus diversus TaxID=327109 RepID=UPI002409D080|nr:glutamate receptor 3-like [Uloborus diversus]
MVLKSFILLSLFLVAVCGYPQTTVKIGIIVERSSLRQNNDKIWTLAQNGSSLVLEPSVRTANSWDSIEVIRAICELVKEGPNALVVHGPPCLNPLLSTYSDHLSLPIITSMDVRKYLGKYQVNVLPDISQATAELLTQYKWDSFVFLYDKDNGADQLQKVFRFMDSVPQVEAFWRISDEYQASQFVRMLPVHADRILLAVSENLADKLVMELSSWRMFHFILMKPVGIVQRNSNQNAYSYTKFSVVDPMEPLLKILESRWKTLDLHPSLEPGEKELPDSVILNHDSSSILYSMYSKLLREGKDIPDAPKQDCFNPEAHIPDADLIKKVRVERSVTGMISFDATGQRKDYRLNIVETSSATMRKVGTWSEGEGLTLTPEFSRSVSPTFASFAQQGPPIIVTSVETWPFLRRNRDGTFTGYVSDLIDELRDVMGRGFDLRLVKDGKYGYQSNGVWNGMIGELIRREADVAIADLTKTLVREEVIDFSENFMTAGLNILLKKPAGPAEFTHFGPFSFLSVWSEGVWLMILLATGVFSALCFAMSRFTGAPDRVRALETKGTDNLSPCGSAWFTVGSLLFRGTGIYPRTISHRLWALVWWAFCLFLLLMYIASLSSELVRTRKSITTIRSKKSSQELLKELLDNGYPAIGTLQSGSTVSFFLKSEIGLYRDFGRYLTENPDVMTKNYDEGAQRVRNSGGSYAFVMESSSSELWADSEPCDILVTSGFLNTMNYAVALQKNSSLKEKFDEAIITLTEKGTLRKLYEKWWHNATGCEDPNLDILPRVYSTSMTLHEVSGLFYLLILFALLSAATAAVEHYIRTKRVTIE